MKLRKINSAGLTVEVRYKRSFDKENVHVAISHFLRKPGIKKKKNEFIDFLRGSTIHAIKWNGIYLPNEREAMVLMCKWFKDFNECK